MAFTLDDLAKIEAAIASGELSIEYNDKRVTYRSTYELLRARSLIRGELLTAGLLPSNGNTGARTTLARIDIS